jgi:hypothetical protein
MKKEVIVLREVGVETPLWRLADGVVPISPVPVSVVKLDLSRLVFQRRLNDGNLVCEVDYATSVP